MKLKIAIGLIILSLPLTAILKAQMKEGYKAEIEIQAIGTTNGTVPFWMRSNQFGSVPLNGVSGSVIGRLSKDYDEVSTSDQLYGRKKIFDWGFGFEGRANGGKNSNVQLIEGYVKAKVGIIQLKGGRSRDVMGLNGDTSLSSGNFAVSGNALGIPKLELSISEYFRLPILDGLLSFKGNFAHGWIGNARIIDSINYGKPVKTYQIENNNPKTYFHQKSLYIKLGKKDWRLNLIGGFSHQVYWGNEKVAYGNNFKLSPSETFLYVITGKAYGTIGIPGSKIGNQLGSIDMALEYKFSKFNLMVYRQNIYDVGALAKLANIRDGLNGISIKNNEFNNDTNEWNWKSFLVEFFYTKNQAGYPSSIPTNSGDEDYYNNYYYKEGWSYKKLSMGNPFITPRKDARPGQAFRPEDYFINNRVVAIHMGFSGKAEDWLFTTKASYSKNYGTFGTSAYGKSTGVERYPQTTNIFKKVSQFSMYVDALKQITPEITGGFQCALDYGNLLDNSIGFQLKLIKSFNK